MIKEIVYPLFLLLGVVVSFEDWRDRKIRNHWIMAGLGLCLLTLGYLLINSVLASAGLHFSVSYPGWSWGVGEYYMPWRFYARVAVHMALSFTAACALWRYSVWPAGDAKLFIVFAFLLPLVDPNLPGFPRLLFVVILINVFVPAGLVLSAETLARLLFKVRLLGEVEWSKQIKALADTARVRLRDHWPQRYNLLALVVNLFCFFTAFRLVQRWLLGAMGGPAGRLLVFCVLVMAWGPIQRILCNHKVGAGAVCLLSAAAMLGALRFAVDILAWVKLGIAMMFNFGMFLSVARVLLGALAERQSLDSVSPSEIHPGMILAENTWQILRREPALAEALGDRYCDGLTAAEADAVKNWLGGQGSKAALVDCRFYRAVPFAIWIFLGCALTFQCRTTVVHAARPALSAAWMAAQRAAPWWSL
jgi:hypothetical protein